MRTQSTINGTRCESYGGENSRKYNPHSHLKIWEYLRISLNRFPNFELRMRAISLPSTSKLSTSFSSQTLRGIKGYPQSKIFEDPWFLKLFLKLFCFIFRGFLRIPQKTSKVLPSFSPQSVRVFEGKFSIPSKLLHHPQPQKSLKNFETPDLNLKNPQTSRMKMRILV